MSQQKPLFVLFDGNALVHRAFHALPPLTSRNGEMVNAVYGFASMLLKVLKDLSPACVAVAFDTPAPTFRHERFEQYKAQRPKAPEELRGQFGKVKQLLASFRIPVFELEGFEADDLLGALSQQAAAAGLETVIVSGDADATQLVGPNVRLLTPGKSFGETKIYDEAAVLEKYGVPPKHIVDLKALVGDTSDNIPGVPGVGPKTAAKLVQQFGTLEDIYAHIDEVTPERLRQTLKDNREQAVQSKVLATIVTDMPVELKPDECRVSGFDRQAVTDLFRELQFVSLLPRLREILGEEAPAAGAPETKKITAEVCFNIVDTPAKLEELVKNLEESPGFVVDL